MRPVWWLMIVLWAAVFVLFALALPARAEPASLAQLCVGPAPSPAPALDRYLLARIDAARAAAGLPPLRRSAAADAVAQHGVCRASIIPRAWQPSDAAYRDLVADRPDLLGQATDWRDCTVGVWHYIHPAGRVIGAVKYGRCQGLPL